MTCAYVRVYAGARNGPKYDVMHAVSFFLKNSAITWSEEKLDAYITNPKAVVPGNRMAFAGLSNPAQVDDIAAYLMSLK